LPVPLELPERPREAGGEGVRNVVVPGDREHRRAERTEICGGRGVLRRASAMRQVAARDDELRAHTLDQCGEARLDLRRLAGAHVQVGDVEEPGWLSRTSGYTHDNGGRAYRDLRRPLSRAASG